MDKALIQRNLTSVLLNFNYKTAPILHSVLFLYQANLASKQDEELKTHFKNLDDRLKKISMNHIDYFSSLLFISLISAFEAFLVETVKTVIIAHPKKVGSSQFKLSDIMNLSRDELILSAAEDYLNKIMYKKPNEYLTELCDILSIDTSMLEKEWPKFIEGKARRDLGVHNSWHINEIYIRKITEAGFNPLANDSRLMNPSNEYLKELYDVCDSLSELIYGQLTAKYS